MSHELVDHMDESALRAMVHHQQALLDRLLSEREGHLVSVEQAFRRRHNDQVTLIADLVKLARRFESHKRHGEMARALIVRAGYEPSDERQAS